MIPDDLISEFLLKEVIDMSKTDAEILKNTEKLIKLQLKYKNDPKAKLDLEKEVEFKKLEPTCDPR